MDEVSLRLHSESSAAQANEALHAAAFGDSSPLGKPVTTGPCKLSADGLIDFRAARYKASGMSVLGVNVPHDELKCLAEVRGAVLMLVCVCVWLVSLDTCALTCYRGTVGLRRLIVPSSEWCGGVIVGFKENVGISRLTIVACTCTRLHLGRWQVENQSMCLSLCVCVFCGAPVELLGVALVVPHNIL